jgi:exodeoxyribonuclease VIII
MNTLALSQNRIERNKPAEEYHSDYSTISKHGLDLIHKAPAIYRHKWLTGHTEPRSEALRWGSLVHLAVLEPHLLNSECIVAPAGLKKTTKEGKAEYAALAATGREVVTMDEMVELAEIARAVHAHPAAAALLAGDIEIENSLYWTDPDTGIALRARPDVIRCDGIIVDLKTCVDASPREFARSASNYRYHVQSAVYLDGARANEIPAEQFAFIAVEKSAPFLVAVYVADAQFVSIGSDAYRRDLHTFKRCLETDQWPGYPDTVQPLSLPAWATRNLELAD